MDVGILAARAVGHFPLSIPTSIALEHLLGLKTEANPEPSASVADKYQEIWINVKTLYRNMLSSCESSKGRDARAREIAEALSIEMEVIDKVFNEYTHGTCKPRFYVSNYHEVHRKYKNATIRGDNTDLQKLFTAKYEEAVKILIKDAVPGGSDLKIFDSTIKPSEKVRGIILTHIAYDLVSSKNFEKLDLLESHTGKIKSRDMWYTKYYNGGEMPFMPFHDFLLPVFGDSEHFRPIKHNAREELIELAKRQQWSSVTTRDRVIYGINSLKNPLLKDTIHSFL